MEKELKELNELLEGAKKSKKGLRTLKIAAVNAGKFELAAKLREMETTLFPDSPEEKEAKDFSMAIKTALAMVGINASMSSAWVIGKIIFVYKSKKGNLSLRDAAEIKAECEKLFKDEDDK